MRNVGGYFFALTVDLFFIWLLKSIKLNWCNTSDADGCLSHRQRLGSVFMLITNDDRHPRLS